jgi:hypothetical protein
MTFQFDSYWCYDCPFTTVIKNKAVAHARETGHKMKVRLKATKSEDM